MTYRTHLLYIVISSLIIHNASILYVSNPTSDLIQLSVLKLTVTYL